MRYIGLDFGDKTIGVAVSDPDGKIALGVETIRRDNPDSLRASISRLGEIIRRYDAGEIILGYPRSMDNSLSERCFATDRFKEKLNRNFKRLPVILWDERLSTVAVTRTLNNKNHVDEMAAVYILQGYLDFKNQKQEDFAMAEEEQNEQNITMTDEEGNEIEYQVLSSKEIEGNTFLMVEEMIPEDTDEEEIFADVLFFKCIATEGEDMVFELVDDEHGEFQAAVEMFRDEFDTLGIEMDTLELNDE